jgi:hypothetical protein
VACPGTGRQEGRRKADKEWKRKDCREKDEIGKCSSVEQYERETVVEEGVIKTRRYRRRRL